MIEIISIVKIKSRWEKKDEKKDIQHTEWCQTKFRVKRQLEYWLESREQKEKKGNNKHELQYFQRKFEPFFTGSLSLSRSFLLLIFHRFVRHVCVVWQHSHTFRSRSTEHSKIAFGLPALGSKSWTRFVCLSLKTKQNKIINVWLAHHFQLWHWFDRPTYRPTDRAGDRWYCLTSRIRAVDLL